MAINREWLTQKTLGGAANPTGQLMSALSRYYLKTIKADPYDPVLARELLAEAGYPDGFAVTLHSPNDRYLKDEHVANAIAVMLNDIGIETHVEAIPKSEFFKHAMNFEYSFSMSGSASPIPFDHLRDLFGSNTPDSNQGVINYAQYSNAKMDEIIRLIGKSKEQAEIEELQREGMLMVSKNYLFIPLYHEKKTWASQFDYKIQASLGSYTPMPLS